MGRNDSRLCVTQTKRVNTLQRLQCWQDAGWFQSLTAQKKKQRGRMGAQSDGTGGCAAGLAVSQAALHTQSATDVNTKAVGNIQRESAGVGLCV